MTVQIWATPPGGDIKARAVAAVQRELADRTGYCAVKRELAEQAIEAYRPAYIQVTDGDDQWAGCAVTWANGGMIGASIDPPQPLYGLRAVLRWVASWKTPEDFDRWMRHVVLMVKPINAMAQLDQELLRTEYALSEKEVADV
jgi:hypothetical protein